MARTKASVGAKVSIGKSSKARCSAPPPSNNTNSGSEKSSRNYSGGNPVCPRETPKWQKPITNFIFVKEKDTDDLETAGSSKSKSKRPIIYSDDESDSEPKNQNNKDSNTDTAIIESQVYDDVEIGDSQSANKENIKEGDNAESQAYGESQDYDLIDSPPKNRELDESIVLQPLTGENSHKLEEFYPKTEKNLKKTSNESNNNKVSYKRDLEDVEQTPSKKMRVQ